MGLYVDNSVFAKVFGIGVRKLVVYRDGDNVSICAILILKAMPPIIPLIRPNTEHYSSRS
jgi:hypothetical protein